MTNTNCPEGFRCPQCGAGDARFFYIEAAIEGSEAMQPFKPHDKTFPPPHVEPLPRSGAILVYAGFMLWGAIFGAVVTWAAMRLSCS